MRVGSRALLESFISVTARERKGSDGGARLGISAHAFLLWTGLNTYVVVSVRKAKLSLSGQPNYFSSAQFFSPCLPGHAFNL